MSPSKREREYARRRHAEWQQRQDTREVQRSRRRSIARLVGAAVLVVALFAAAVAIGTGGSGDPATSAAGASQAAASSAPPVDACPAPTSAPPAEPVQLDAAPDPSAAQGRTWTATIATSCGDVVAELDGAAAPAAVASFVTLAQQDFFAGTPCHRLTTQGISVLQCGDPTGTGTGGPGYTFGPVENAPADDVYPAGTLAMARRGGDAQSMGSQFFVVYEDSAIPSDAAGGYTVFGRVTSGLDVVERVAAAGDDGSNGPGDGAPTTPISIEQVTVQ
ncbi:peptidylprolyl isomerase [Quadrisphaera sp. DSM 44207]|uniref:peptidylprolyl isomerase n=1 Tax=Quadrisphaera sp. DSM 44207 TaxID=1881057 RepID=UPI00089132FB|nr:peptidylprolyl isomerase [Quadrisphaera sp. DSM 44207]SDQ47517.1 peptidyl-prolyl cis-trans isomerase B (cyclophilin B) [Quadrisphaera sp. DSM 44207]